MDTQAIRSSSLPERGLSYLVTNMCPEWLSLGATAIQTATLKAQETNTDVSERIHQTQVLFNAVNLAFVGWEAVNLSNVAFTAGLTLGTASGTLSFVVATIAIPRLLNKYYTPTTPLQQNQETLVSWDRPMSQSFGRILYSTRMMANIALGFLSTSHQLYFAVTALGMGFSLLKTSQLKWIKISRNFGANTFHYHALLLPYKGNDNCSICTDEAPESYFCENKHAFHDYCLPKWFQQKSEQFNNNSVTTVTETRHHTNGAYTGTTYSALIEIPQENLPTCPNCRSIPGHTFIDANRTGCSPTRVSISNAPPKFTLWSSKAVETGYVAYNALQASLIWLIDKRPELIANILAMQNIMIISDLAALIRDCIALKESLDSRNEAYPIRKLFFFAINAGFAVILLNRTLQPAIDLKDSAVSLLGLTTQEAAKVTLSWSRTFTDQFVQWLYLVRIGVNGVSIYHSRRSALKLMNVAFQAFSLIKLAQLPWLKVEQKVSLHIPSYVSVREANMSFYFLPSRIALASKEKLQTALKSIYDYTSNLFKDSQWTFLVKTRDGILSFSYDIIWPNGRLPFADKLSYLASFSGTAYHPKYGSATLDL